MATKKATPAQLAARKKFAEMARSGALAKKRKAAAKKTAKRAPAKKTVSQKISQLMHEGYPQKQAIAVALSEQRAGKVKRKTNPTTVNFVDDAMAHGFTAKQLPSGKIRFTDKKGNTFLYSASQAVRYGTWFDEQKYNDVRLPSFEKRKANPTPSKQKVSAVVLMKNPTAKKLYTVHRADANGNPVYHIAHFAKRADAVQYAKAYADLHGKQVIITTKAL